MNTIETFKKRDMEIWLEKIPAHEDPRPELEQYTTPAPIAADILFTAYTLGDIRGREVIDLGCGTGIFSLGAARMGAEKVYGVDIDEKSVQSTKRTARDLGLSDRCDFVVSPVENVNLKGDTVIMNPPFGSQKKGADTPFLEKAFEIAPRIYSLHNARGEDYVRRFVHKSGYRVFGEKRYMFPVNRLFSFHKKEKKEFETVLLMCERY